MEIKTAPFRVKAGPDQGLPDGSFEGYASVFGNIDSYGDIVDPGAFTKTLADWRAKGAPIPILYAHDVTDPFNNIGAVTSATQDEKGLHVTGQLDLDNPTAAQVYRLLKGARVDSMSFAYGIRDASQEDDAHHLKDLDLYEVSVVQNPANDQAAIESVKMATTKLVDGFKAGRVLAQKHIDSLHTAYDALGSVIAAAEADTLSEDASGSGTGKSVEAAEEPERVKAAAADETGAVNPSVDALAVMQSILIRKGR